MLAETLVLIYLLAHQPQLTASRNVVLASHSFSMADRYGNSFVNGVFSDNILLTLHYMNGDIKAKNEVNWSTVEAPFKTEFTLNPGQEFAFHDKVLPTYSNDLVKTTNSHFNWAEGFKYDGDLVGDGVCHLASLMYWAAKDAGLTTYAPSNHNFAKINEVPKVYGVAIQSPLPMGNLYIKNTLDKPVTFVFDYDGKNLNIDVTQIVN